MKKKLALLFLLSILCHKISGQINLEKKIFQLNEYNDTLTIDGAIKKFSQKKFNKPFPVETYKYFRDKEASWIVIEIDSLKEDTYLSIENSLFEELKLYRFEKGKVSTPQDLNKIGEYRFPLWFFEKTNTPFKLFIRTKDKFSYRTEFNIVTFSKINFINKVEKDYFLIGSYVLSMLILLIAVTLIFFFKKNYIILWYTVHLSILIVEYLISSGVFSQWFLDNSIILKYGLDQLTMVLSIFVLTEFFRAYYKFNKKTLIFKKIYRIMSIICLSVAIYSIIDTFCGNIFNIEIFAQNILTFASIISLIIHFFLTYHKVIPKYIFIAFLLPVIGVFANLGGFKSLFTNENVVYFIFNSVYVGIVIGGLTMIIYIIKESTKSEIEAISLSKEHSQLKNEFQENLSEIQEKHQNMLVNDVHDSFGGYLEALKLNLIKKERNNQEINSLLDAFRKDYKLLLNSLFTPNISAGNFENAIQEYCDKMNELSSSEIVFISRKETYVQLPQNIAKLIYKAASELTTNAIKYAKSKNISVNLTFDKREILLKVIDDGVGFNIKNISKTSLGLINTKERVEILNGDFTIETKKNKGTIITIRISLNTDN